MGASITLAGESLIAQKLGAQQPLIVSRFVLANVPSLDPNAPVDRAAGKPAAGQIVAAYDVTQKGYVNPNQVVYSLMMGSDVGDFDWNWIGLETAENVLLAVAYVPVQQKRRNIPPLQLGNNVTRNFLVVFDGAQALTGITIDASTWQHDFTVRLAGIDERERLSNRDLFGRACFFADAFKLEQIGSGFQLKAGMAYLEGIRLEQPSALSFSMPSLPNTVYVDVVLQREMSDAVARWYVVCGQGLTDYVDGVGAVHYRVPVAQINTAASITDMRVVEPVAEALIRDMARRSGDYPQLRARATQKADVGLSEIPNAISSDVTSDDPQVLATTQLVATVRQQIDQAIAEKLPLAGGVMVGAVQFDARNYTHSWARGFDFNIKGEAVAGIGGYGDTGSFKSLYMALGDKPYVTGNGIRINEAGVDIVGIISGNGSKLSDLKAESLTGTVAVERLSGTYKINIEGQATTASKLVTARNINRVAFDGSADITIEDDSKLPLDGGVMKGDLVYSSKNYLGGWARGLIYESQGVVSGGMGGLGSSEALQMLYMALGATPYNSGTGMRLTPGNVSFEGLMSGNGGGLNNLNASSLAQGIIPVLRLLGKNAFEQNDYVRIPDVPGGLIIQFGIAESYPNTTKLNSLPVAFPNKLLFCSAQVTEGWSSDITVRFIPVGNRLSQFYLDNSYTSNGPAYFLAIGY